jgi:D-alanine-D-alanine ligase
LETLNIQNGCLQFEAKWTKKGPMPLEINMRMGGDEAYSFARDAWGVDLIEGTMRIATRVPMKKIDKSKYPKKYFAGDTINAPYSGVVSKIEIDSDLKNCDYLENLVLYKKVGDSVLAPPFGYEYMGWLAVSGPNPVDANEKLKQVLKKINYSVVKFDESSSMGRTIRHDNNKNAVFSVNKKFIGKERIEKIRSIPLAQQRKLHIGIVGNDFSPEKDNGNNTNEQIEVGKNIAKTLTDVGYKVSLFDFNLPQKAINDLNKSRVDLVFNICDRINDTSLLKPHAASAFDILQIPYTGSNPITLALCQDKIKFKKLLSFHNIPTSAWDCVYSLDDEVDPNLKFPLIVKPSNTDNSIGISNHSIVTNRKELDKRVRYILKDLGSPVLIEEYIDGDEYDAFIMGNDEKNFKVLPLCRTIFSSLPEEYWHIKTIKTKLGRDKTYQEKIISQIPPLKTNSKLMRLITEIAIDTYNILDCHDYGLVEIKTDKYNNPYILEMNTNPRLGINNFGPQTAKLSGMKYSDLLEDIIRLAIERYKKNPPYHHLQTNAS